MKANSFTKLLVQDSSKGDKNVLKLESNTIREISSGYTGTFYLLIYFFTLVCFKRARGLGLGAISS